MQRPNAPGYSRQPCRLTLPWEPAGWGGRAWSWSSGLAAQTEGGRCGLLRRLEGYEILIFALQILPAASSGPQAESGDFLFSQAWWWWCSVPAFFPRLPAFLANSDVRIRARVCSFSLHSFISCTFSGGCVSAGVTGMGVERGAPSSRDPGLLQGRRLRKRF